MPATSPTDTRVLYELKSRGPQAAQALAALLDITSMGARKQLLRLEAAGLVRSSAEAGGIGRPSRVFTLTEAGHAQFPDTHSHLTVELLASVEKLFGESGLDALIAERESASLAAYTDALAGHQTLGARVAALTEVRSREGYMATCDARADGTFVLAENHCPICAAASACQGLCRSELALFQAVLGDDAIVRRTEHLLEGARRCSYLITPKDA